MRLRLAVSFATTTTSASHISRRGSLAPRLNRLAIPAAATKRHLTLHHHRFDEPSSNTMASGEGECKDGLRIAVQGCVGTPPSTHHPSMPCSVDRGAKQSQIGTRPIKRYLRVDPLCREPEQLLGRPADHLRRLPGHAQHDRPRGHGLSAQVPRALRLPRILLGQAHRANPDAFHRWQSRSQQLQC